MNEIRLAHVLIVKLSDFDVYFPEKLFFLILKLIREKERERERARERERIRTMYNNFFVTDKSKCP